ncbi:carbohydrate kinase family protein [Candidatus Parcubacteria bacterium]|nr:carbohydrate kinase family protein [Candidatus Parcubacteria bacterium]
MAERYDFLAIGDVVTDAFIRLKEASVHCTINREKCEICMAFTDKIPYESVTIVPAVGNSPNAAVSASRLGLKSALVSDVGGDYFGTECLEALKVESVSAEFVRVHQDHKTNYHYVLWYEDDRTILVKHEDFPYALPDINDPGWVYLSSLGEYSLPYHEAIIDYLEKRPAVKLAFQPGTFQMKFGRERLQRIYERADVFFCNTGEARKILRTEEQDKKKLLFAMHDLGPKIVVITDGIKGAYAFDGKEALFMRAYPDPKPPYERTGAGDAFSSTFAVALCFGFDVRTALKWGPINSMSVVQQVGARGGLLTREKLEAYLKTAPADYEPRPI